MDKCRAWYRDPLYAAFFILLLLRGLGYWVASAVLYPNAEMDFHAIFRRWGDVQYYPLIRAMADFNFGEPNVLEHLGEGWISFPFLSVSPYAASFKLFGAFGFPVMDALLVCVQFVLFFYLFCSVRISRGWAAGLSLFIVSNSLNYLFVIDDAVLGHFTGNSLMLGAALALMLVSIFLAQRPTITEIAALTSFTASMLLLPYWDNANVLFQMRIPRPLVTDVFFLFGVLSILNDRLRGANARRGWLLFGISLSLTLQGNLHSAGVLGLFGLFWLVFDAYERRKLKDAITNALCVAITFLAASSSFIYQRLTESSEMAERLGVVILDRLHPLFLTSPIELGQLAACVLLAFATSFVGLGHRGHTLNKVSRFILFMTVASYLALPVSWVALGKGNYLHQFRDRYQLYATLALVVGTVYLLHIAASSLLRRVAKAPTAFHALKAVFVGVCLVSTIAAGYRPAATKSHTRDNFEPLKALGDSYKPDFLELTATLKSLDDSEFKVLGTFDPQLFSWWRLFRGGYVYVTDNFSTALPPEIFEDRFLSFCKIIGMNLMQFEEFTNSFLGSAMWMEVGKLSPLGAIQRQDFSGYSPKDQEALKKLTIMNSWDFHFTVSHRQELNRAFTAKIPDQNSRLDAIVLINDPLQENLTPPAERFELKLQNRSFRLFTKKRP